MSGEPSNRSPEIDSRAIAFDEAVNKRAVKIEPGSLHEAAFQLEKRLSEIAEAGLYQRGGSIVEITRIKTTAGKNISRSTGTPIIRQVSIPRLRERGTRYIAWERFDSRKNDYKPVDCPRDVAETMAAKGEFSLPVLVSVLGSPTIRPNGELISQPGYDKESGVYLYSDKWKKLKKHPTKKDAIKSREVLEELVSEFPFTDDAARSTWLAALCTALIRWSLRSAPFFGFDAPVMGSGKTLLASLVGYLGNGFEPAAMNYPRNDEEVKKTLFSALQSGDTILLIDNVERMISGEALCTIATSDTYRDRILGRSEMLSVPTNVTIMLTGNNLIIRGDLSTRILICRLDPGVEHPEERSFKQKDIREHVLKNREIYVNAALTVMRAYAIAKYPDVNLKPFGRFEEWSLRVRAPLVWTGCADPCETRKQIEDKDPVRENLHHFFGVWYRIYGENNVMVNQMIADSGRKSTDDIEQNLSETDRNDLEEVLFTMAGDGKAVNARRLGRAVAKHEGRIVGGLKLLSGNTCRNSKTWRLVKVEDSDRVGLSVKSVNNIANAESVRNMRNSRNAPKETDTNRLTDSVIKQACEGLSLTSSDLRSKLSSHDLQDIAKGDMSLQDLRAYAEIFDKKKKGA